MKEEHSYGVGVAEKEEKNEEKRVAGSGSNHSRPLQPLHRHRQTLVARPAVRISRPLSY